jgi:RNA recognition motif. (a.k.a. RRM, RBD, or RNP domain)
MTLQALERFIRLTSPHAACSCRAKLALHVRLCCSTTPHGHCMAAGRPPHLATGVCHSSGPPPPTKKSSNDIEKDDAKGKEPAAKASTDAKAPAATAEAQNGAAAKPAAKDGGRAADVSNTKLHVGKLTRNVTQEHMREIFATFGKLKSVELAMDRTVRCAMWHEVGC